MKVTVEDYKGAQPNGHPLFESGKDPAQFAGHFLFIQVLTGLVESPVKFLLHDRQTGIRKLVTVEREAVDLEMISSNKKRQVEQEERKVVITPQVQRVTIKLPEKAQVKVEPPKVVSPPVTIVKSPQVSLKSPSLKSPSLKK